MVGMVFEELIVNQFLQSYASPLLTLFFSIITFFGNPVWWFMVAAWLFWVGKEKKSFVLMTVILFSSAITGVLKLIIARPRPEGVMLLDKVTDFSMPSGHSTIISSVYSFYEQKLAPNLKYLFLLLVILVAISRLYLGVHFVSDVFVGLILGYAIGKGIVLVQSRLEKAHFHVSTLREEIGIIVIFGGALAGLFFLSNEYAAGQALLGYFAGYIAFHNSRIKLSLHNKKKKIVYGTLILGALTVGAYLLNDLSFASAHPFAQGLFFLSGVFVSFIWPWVCAKLKL